MPGDAAPRDPRGFHSLAGHWRWLWRRRATGQRNARKYRGRVSTSKRSGRAGFGLHLLSCSLPLLPFSLLLWIFPPRHLNKQHNIFRQHSLRLTLFEKEQRQLVDKLRGHWRVRLCRNRHVASSIAAIGAGVVFWRRHSVCSSGCRHGPRYSHPRFACRKRRRRFEPESPGGPTGEGLQRRNGETEDGIKKFLPPRTSHWLSVPF